MMANQGDNATHESSCSYHVFLSFRGEDTRHSFTGFLYDALSRRGFRTFMDDEGLKEGDQISQSLVKAIEESRISVVVFSENYASSTWCLDELVKILECMKLKNQLVWPIFYKVAPSDVRHQRNSYAEAMAAHEERFGAGSNEVQKWRSALSEVANLKGLHYETDRYEYEFIQEIVEKATAILQPKLLDVGEQIIGHQFRIEEVKSHLDIESRKIVCMLGIHGTGGMGKTILAKALYNSIIHQFECAIFLEDVRERSNSHMGLVHLQEAILSKIFEGENIKLDSVSEGVTRLKDSLQHRRVLLVLDDVDNENQLEKLARNCNWFGSGSRIIITTRDKDVLDIHKVEKRYEMKGLNYNEALQLFCWKAFKSNQPAINYEDVSNCAIHYAGGLPLALKVIGSHMADKSVEECKDQLKKYKTIQEKNILDILRISYDCLEDTAQCVFLDIACFFKGNSLQYVEEVLEKCDFFPSDNIKILVNKSLLAVEDGRLRMHDLIQDMGRAIVRQKAPSKPGERCRLYFYKDVLRVLRENSGSSNIEGIMLDPPKIKKLEWSGIAFEKMNNLRILIIRKTHFIPEPNYLPNSLRLLDWEMYPSKSLPSKFIPRDIVHLSLPSSHLILEKEKPFPKLKHLTCINFYACQLITHFPDASGVPNLTKLDLRLCKNLIAIHRSVGFLKNLEYLSACNCIKLKDFLPTMCLPSLQYLDLRSTAIEFFPHIGQRMCKPLLESPLPTPISDLSGLEQLSIRSSHLPLEGLPSDLFLLPKIASLCIQGLRECSPKVVESFRRFLNSHVITTIGNSASNKPHCSPLRALACEGCGLTDEDLHVILCCFPNLEELSVQWNELVSLPASIKESANLISLDVGWCMELKEIPELPLSLQEVLASGCYLLSSEAYEMLWSQLLKEVHGLFVVIPKMTTIPSWFDHRCKGGIVSFWARRNFPVVAVAFILTRNELTQNIRLYINGCDACRFSHRRYNFLVKQEDMLLFDLRKVLEPEGWPILNTFLVDEWNYVEVRCKWDLTCKDEDGVSHCGAYVYKRETNMEDIRFKCPKFIEGTPSIVDNP